MTTDRGLLLIGGGILALVVIAVVVVLVAGHRSDATFEPGSPEAAIQTYLSALDEDDLEAAYTAFSTNVQERWSLEDYRRTVDSYPPDFGRDTPRRVLFDRVDETDGRARVHLTVEEFYGDGLSGDTYRSSRQIRMVREADDWRIDDLLVWLDPAPTHP